MNRIVSKTSHQTGAPPGAGTRRADGFGAWMVLRLCDRALIECDFLWVTARFRIPQNLWFSANIDRSA
ncbi:hypothetical protein [Brucella intermedia]|uniref:hypothetical protein n=1 Tax=Brucella intermedia TaxID=94625 RepID=UPI0023612BC2|nr:hypothetical protein [Brucella intermedia]